jgi:hypothetical protein
MTDSRDTTQITWDAIRQLRTAAWRLQTVHNDPTAQDVLDAADTLADELMTPQNASA